MNRDPRVAAVLGAGTMGRGIAQVAAGGGFLTRVYEIDAEVLQQAQDTIARHLEKGVQLGKITSDDAERTRQNLHYVTGLEAAVVDADLVIEAVPESMSVKSEIFRAIGQLAPPSAIFTSNTSALSITEIAAASGRPSRFAGMHFFNPVHLMRLVEVVRGLETTDETVAAVSAAAERMGKQVVVVRESPGFVTSRINALIGNEAFRMLEQGVADARDIDLAVKLGLNHPMGPFEMADLVGLDVRLSILQHLQQTLGDLYRPSNLLRQYVQAGRLGRKSGRGVYHYDDQGRRIEP